ncbi:glypican-4 [Phlebotomus argentipes]|uniref:glypican-4 n=1 Tax=Phlebotomus argentipes TaxID=94469 RepID=UPI0028931478|nr:glypican-4 [Phlebotomus argentipes]
MAAIVFISRAALWTSSWILLLCLALPARAAPSLNTGVCAAVTHFFEAKGLRINPNEIPKEPIKDLPLKYCSVPVAGTCCSYNMETRLADVSRLHMERQTKELIGKLASVLHSRAQKFNDYFKDLLSESKKEFHAMFKRTYGAIYEQNSYVFSDLFTELEGYYARGKVDLSEAMDSFFNTLYQKMFTVLNSQFTFDDKYLGCVSEHMKQLKPFGDVPDKLSVQIKRSFVATRTYAQSLATAADIVKNMMNIKPHAECVMALTKMQCNVCSGQTAKPCANYCVNVMKGCLQHHMEMDHEWDNFLTSMEKLSDRLLGPFNVVMVVEPINIKISEAIMNFQETNKDISNQVFQGCGRPMLGRKRRQVTDPEGFTFDDEETTRQSRSAEPTSQELSKFEPLRFSNSDNYSENGRKGKKNKNRNKARKGDNYDDDYSKEPVLDKLIKDIRQKVKDTKNFWSNLPYQICNNEDLAAAPSMEDYCWNGHAVDRYLHPVISDNKQNPEFPGNTPARRGAILDAQLYNLRTSISQLKNAYNGLDVEWSDQEEGEYGSGSGSGVDDDEDSGGSGMGGYDFEAHIPPHITHNEISPGRDSLPGNASHPAGGRDELPSPPRTGDDDAPEDTHFNELEPKGGTESGATRIPEMSIGRALVTYMFPIFMAWFGGMFAELL